MSPKAGFLRSLFKAPILTEKLLFLETSLYYRIFDVDSLDHWHFLRIWLRDIPNVLAFKVEAALKEYDLTWEIHLDKLHVFTGEWGSIWLKNNWVWFDFSIMVLREKYTLLISQKYKYCYHLENVQTLTLVKVCLLCSYWLA